MTTKRSKCLLITNSYNFSSRFGQSIYHCPTLSMIVLFGILFGILFGFKTYFRFVVSVSFDVDH